MKNGPRRDKETSNKSAPSPAVESMWSEVIERPDTHPSMCTGKPVANGEAAVEARMGLEVIGVLALIAGVILLIASFNTIAAHSALVTLVCGSLLTLIGSIAAIALLAVKANAKS